MEPLEALPCADKLEVFGLLIAFDMRFWDLKLVAILGVTEANASVLESILSLLQIGIKFLLDVVDTLVGTVKDLVNAWLGLGNLSVASPSNSFPFN